MKQAQCGTKSGYQRHRRLKEESCEACRKANSKYVSDFYQKNPENKRIQSAKARAKFPEKSKANSRAWYYRNKEKAFAYSAARRARKNNAITEFYTTQQVLDVYGTSCHICNKEIDLNAPRSTKQKGWEFGLHIDHVIPLSKGGSDTMDNVRPAHGLCNISKGHTVQEVANA